MSGIEETSALLADSNSAPNERPLPVAAATVSNRDLNSFPCLSPSSTERLISFFELSWATAKRLLPCAKRMFLYCEDYELPGAFLIASLVFLFVLAGFLLVFPSLHSPWLRVPLQSLFTLQAIVGYACLYLFRNTNPGYLPVNEGALDPETAELLSRPEYTQTSLIATRPYVPVYTEAELEAKRVKEQQDEAQGIYDHLNIYGLAQPVLEQEWCRTCRLWRPPRAAHCYQCQQCVTRMDHHCALLGNCVGIKNHRMFLAFIFLVGSGAATLALSCFLWLLQQLLFVPAAAGGGLWSGETWLAFFLLFPFLLASGVLFIAYFHFWLLLSDVTLREKYGRKRTSAERSSLGRKEKFNEIWSAIINVPEGWEWKKDSVGIRNKQAARRGAADPYRAQKVAPDSSTAASTSSSISAAASNSSSDLFSVVVVPPGEEQVGCTGVVDSNSQNQLQHSNESGKQK